jgi:hypothetical protein
LQAGRNWEAYGKLAQAIAWGVAPSISRWTRSNVIFTPNPPLDSSAASVVGAFSSAFFIRTPRVPPQHDSSEAAPAPAAFDICPVIYQTCGSSAALPVFACYLQAE